MISRNCPMAYIKGCKDDRGCKTCQYSDGFMLKDRMGKKFRMQRGDGFTTIYNSVPVMILDRLDEVQKSGVTSFRLDFTFEENITEIQEMYYDYLNKIVDRNEAVRFMDEFKLKNEVTNGHFFRGVV
jgi:putative protease